MTVRLSDEAAEHIDAALATGRFTSRAQYLTWLVEREVQRQRGWADIQRMRSEGTLRDAEADAIVKATSGRALPHLD